MEAVGIYNFQATSEEEISFRKGDQLKVLNTVDDTNWYTAQLGARLGRVPLNYIKLKENNWYHGAITRIDAEKLLSDKHEGAFLVRASQCLVDSSFASSFTPSLFSLSLKCANGVQHFKVLQNPEDKFYLWAVKFNSLNEMVEYYRSVSISRSQEIVLRDKPKFVMALYDYFPQECGMLDFNQGNIITVLNSSRADWWEGKINARRGLFPATYVSAIQM